MKRCLILFALFLGYLVQVNAQNLSNAFSKSYQYETNADYKSAVHVLKEVYGDGSYELNMRLGWLHYKLALNSESMNYYAKAIAQMPYSIEAKLGYVNAAAAAGMWDRVTEQYLKILAIDPQNSLVNYRLGLVYYNKKDYKTAFKYFEKVVNLYPFDYDSSLMFAWTNYQLGKYREAKILFNKVLLIAPGDKSASEGLSMIK